MSELEDNLMSDDELDAYLADAQGTLLGAIEMATDVEQGLQKITAKPRPGVFSQGEIDEIVSKGA